MNQEETIKSLVKLMLNMSKRLKEQSEKIDYLTEAVDILVQKELDRSRSISNGRPRRNY